MDDEISDEDIILMNLIPNGVDVEIEPGRS